MPPIFQEHKQIVMSLCWPKRTWTKYSRTIHKSARKSLKQLRRDKEWWLNVPRLSPRRKKKIRNERRKTSSRWLFPVELFLGNYQCTCEQSGTCEKKKTIIDEEQCLVTVRLFEFTQSSCWLVMSRTVKLENFSHRIGNTRKTKFGKVNNLQSPLNDHNWPGKCFCDDEIPQRAKAVRANCLRSSVANLFASNCKLQGSCDGRIRSTFEFQLVPGHTQYSSQWSTDEFVVKGYNSFLKRKEILQSCMSSPFL